MLRCQLERLNLCSLEGRLWLTFYVRKLFSSKFIHKFYYILFYFLSFLFSYIKVTWQNLTLYYKMKSYRFTLYHIKTFQTHIRFNSTRRLNCFYLLFSTPSIHESKKLMTISNVKIITIHNNLSTPITKILHLLKYKMYTQTLIARTHLLVVCTISFQFS